jgi:hypothetical protein
MHIPLRHVTLAAHSYAEHHGLRQLLLILQQPSLVVNLQCKTVLRRSYRNLHKLFFNFLISKQVPTTMFLFKFLSYHLYGLRTFRSPQVHQSKLVSPSLHLSAFAAYRLQLFAQFPVPASVLGPDLPVRQFAPATNDVIQNLVLARGAALFHCDAVSVDQQHLYACLIHILLIL